MQRMEAISRHFERVPPLSVSVYAIATALGMKSPESATKNPTQLAETLGGVGFSQEKPEWLTEALKTA